MILRYSYRWFFLALFSLGLGGGFAFLVAMSRTPFGYKYFPPDYLYRALAGHVVLAILLWLLSFSVVLWSLYLKFARGVTGLPHWIMRSSSILSLMGIVLVTLSVLFGHGMAVPNNYVPTIVDPLFFAGISIFFVGFSINVFGHLKEALQGLRERDIFSNSLSLSVWIAVVMVFSMGYSLIVHREPAEPFVYYERLFWTAGHIQQILNGSLLISVWYALLRILRLEGRGWKILRVANLSLLLSAIFLCLLQIFIDPLDKNSRVAAEIVYTIGLGIPVFLHIANILQRISSLFFQRGGGLSHTGKGTDRVAYISLLLSMAIYIAGVAIAYSGFGNDLRVPAHYHGAVTGLTLALMGLSYYLIRERTGRIFWERIAKIQPVIYGIGMLLFILGLFISGVFGAPRKTYGVAFTSDPVVLSALTVMGIGTIFAVSGGILFITYIAITVFRHQRIGEFDERQIYNL